MLGVLGAVGGIRCCVVGFGCNGCWVSGLCIGGMVAGSCVVLCVGWVSVRMKWVGWYLTAWSSLG